MELISRDKVRQAALRLCNAMDKLTPWAADLQRAEAYRDNPPGKPVGSASGHQIDAQYWPEPGESCTRPECADREAGR